MVALVVLLLLALIVIGVRALLSTLDPGDAPAVAPSAAATASATASDTDSAQSPDEVPTVRILCKADTCPVFVRVPGGDVLVDRDLAAGEQASYFEPELDVVLGDGSTVQVFENGELRPAGKPGQRESFKVTRAQDH